jgi:uncharacterized protein CbrC (UPF0167 family)
MLKLIIHGIEIIYQTLAQEGKMKKRIMKLSNKKIADFCFEQGWRTARLPLGFPDKGEIWDIANGNSPDILEEAYKVAPHLNVWEYIALRCCQDDCVNTELWEEKEERDKLKKK